MIRIAVDTTLEEKLREANERVELCDAHGRILGLFLPVQDYEQLVRAEDNCPYSPAELSKLHEETDGRSLADILKDLQTS